MDRRVANLEKENLNLRKLVESLESRLSVETSANEVLATGKEDAKMYMIKLHNTSEREFYEWVVKADFEKPK